MAGPAALESGEKRRPLVAITGTSRDVGKYTALAFAVAEWNVLGGFRSDKHRSDQELIVNGVRALGRDMFYVEGDLNRDETIDQYVEKAHLLGGVVGALVMNTGAGLRGTLEESIAFNYGRNLALLRALAPMMPDGAPVVFNQSIQAHTDHPEAMLYVPDIYINVREGKRFASTQFRLAFTAGGEFERFKYIEVVGNALDQTFVTDNWSRRRPEESKIAYWDSIGEFGHTPSAQDYANSIVKVVTKPYPNGHTEYVGVRPRYREHLPEGYGELVGPPPMRADSIMTREQVEDIIPHRWPINFIGGVLELVPGERASGHMVNLIHPDINWRGGHFPGFPVIPGVITEEAMNQFGAMVILSKPEYKGRVALLTELIRVRFLRMLQYGDEARIEVEGVNLQEDRGGSASGTGKARAYTPKGKLAVEGDLGFTLAPAA
ncbi:SDR family NAD(P)-dependent oxidoreductase [Candidatus Daviesbacteria bacterium]|nr:SDR family NAD(P)-dependent oxidoreductase [Candidatus Daviesbacteria bacterium]